MRLRPAFAVTALALIAVGAFGYAVLSHKAPVLTAVTWPGPYGQAQASALFEPYAQRSGVNVRIAQYDGDLAALRASRGWDVVDLELPNAIAACREGLLERIDASALPAGLHGEPAGSDFVANALGPCWVGSIVYAQVIAYAPGRFATKPATLADFFDLARFPGPRALRGKSAKDNLELALLADGVAPAQVYKVLSTPEGMARALAKLDTIRSRIVWADGGQAAMLSDGRAAMAAMLNGDVHDATAHGTALGTIWDHQLYELDVFAIPKGSPRRTMAMDFIRFATSPQSLARVAGWVPFGPARRSALPLVGRNPETGAQMRAFLATAPENFATAFAIDDGWWQAHGAEIAPRWESWKALPNR